MTAINLGKVKITPRGAYDNTTQYKMLDLVSYNGSSYIALGDTLGNLPTNTTYWQVNASKGNTGATGSAGVNGQDGFSPTAIVTKVGDTTTIAITDKNGTTTASVKDGTGGIGNLIFEDFIDGEIVSLGTGSISDTTAPVLTISPSGGNFNTSQVVTMTVNETADIYYTTDGSTPTTSSAKYTTPITLNATTTVKAFARDTAGNASVVQSIVFTKNAVDTTAPVLTITPNGSTFSATQNVTMSTNETATIYYTTDGSTPTTSSLVYSGQITLSATTTIKAFAKDTAGNSSSVQTLVFTKSASDVTPPVLTITPSAIFTTSQIVTMTTDEVATIYYTTDGSTPTTSSTVYSGQITLNATTTIKAFAKDSVGNSSSVQTIVYTKNTADITPPILTMTSGQDFITSVNVQIESNEAGNIYYTTNGSTPTSSSTLYNETDASNGLTFNNTVTIKAITYDLAGNPSAVVTQTFIKVLAKDTFTRADNTVLGTTEVGNLPWYEPSSFNGLGISGNAVKSSVSGSYQQALVDIPEIAYGNYEITAEVVLGTGIAGIMFRFGATHSDSVAFRTGGTETSIRAWENSGSTTLLVGNAYVPTIGSTITMKVRVQGNNIKGYINDVLYCEVNNYSFNSDKTKVGVMTNDTATTFNDFKVVSL